MLFSEMTVEQLSASLEDHKRRLDEGRGSDVYQGLLAGAVRQIEAALNEQPQ